MNRGVDGGEFLQTPHPPKALHRAFPSSEWQVRVFPMVVRPTPRLLTNFCTDLFRRGAIGAQAIGNNPLAPAFTDLGEHRSEPAPPEPNGRVAHVDAPLMEQILDVPQREPKSDAEETRPANHPGAGFEIAKWRSSGHGATLRNRPAPFRRSSSDGHGKLPRASRRQRHRISGYRPISARSFRISSS